MSWIKVYIHIVFATKNREPFLDSIALRQKVFNHIKENSIKKEIWIDSVNGYTDHAHCLVSLGRKQTISDIVHLIKGESSFWINQKKLTENKFAWQDDYWCVGVSESHIDRVRKYIHNQETHHTEKSFAEEEAEFMQHYGSVG